MAVEESDDTAIKEAEQQINQLQATAEKRELESLLSGEADDKDAYLEINAGAGGTEAQDWAEMLLRMYLRWTESRGYSAKMVNQSMGEEAGIKSATIEISGENAYGWLKTETGVHRLVRISPFDSSNRRHTSFASVSVTPVVDDGIEVELDPSDIRVDTFRASGAGGQHVNKTDSAVRMTHEPTGIVVSCQNERSQHANREQAMKMLRAKLYEAEMQRRRKAAEAVEAAKTDIGWGHQIRSYVLHPYQMVKDMRTEVETSQTDKVLDGEIDLFLEAALAHGVENSIVSEDGDGG
jgi:peptide chain release factor 2